MAGMELKATFVVAMLPVLLAACGGGGNGGVASTPAPPVGPQPNVPSALSPSIAFTNMMQSGNFATLAVREDFQNAGSRSTPNYKHDTTITNAVISYDAVKNTYSLGYTDSNFSRRVDFINPSPAPDVKIIASGSPDPTEIGYSKNDCFMSGCSSDLQTVTHTGAGSFVYTYTAFATFAQDSDSFTSGAGAYDTLAVFGFLTPAASVPRSGSATYTLDLMGTNSGTGSGKVDFGGGTYSFSGTLNSNAAGTLSGTFNSNGTLASSANGFSGYVDVTTKYESAVSSGAIVNQTTTYRGVLGGAFFGPQAQELGGVFNAPAVTVSSTDPSNPAPAPNAIAAFTGAILGHK